MNREIGILDKYRNQIDRGIDRLIERDRLKDREK